MWKKAVNKLKHTSYFLCSSDFSLAMYLSYLKDYYNFKSLNQAFTTTAIIDRKLEAEESCLLATACAPHCKLAPSL